MLNEYTEKKRTIEEIRERFDQDVERFSNLQTGQTSIIDALKMMSLITESAYLTTSPIKKILDIGCGGGNNTLKFLQLNSNVDCDLLDLSKSMLDKAEQRIKKNCKGIVHIIQSDIRTVNLLESHYDVIFAAAVLHHLRTQDEWVHCFQKIYKILRPGGSFWITDLIKSENGSIQSHMWKQYESYLCSVGGESFQKEICYLIDKEDTPQTLLYQIELLKSVGFSQIEILHKNNCFAAFGAIK